MADNVPITAGAGTAIATDDVGSAHYQKIKIDAGGDGVSVPVVAGQQTMAASVPVVLASDQGALPVTDNGGSITVDGTVAVTAAALPLPSGAATSALQGGGLPAALGAGGGLKVDGSGTALPVSIADAVAVTGTFYQGTQPVSAATLPLPTGASTAALQGGGLPAALGAGGGLKVDGSGTALPVSGTVTIQDGGNTITVDGTVTAAGVQPAVADFTLSLDTNAYATGDVLAATQEIASAVASAAGKALLVSIVLNDKDDQGGALDLVFLRTNVSIGSENSAVSVADADADEILGIVQVAAGDWLDLGGCRVATIPASRCGIELTAGAGATSIYLAAISRDAKTYSASGITGHLGLERY